MSEEKGKRPQAVRLTFAYHGDEVELIAQQPVETVTPPSDEVEEADRRSGFWYQVEDARGEPLYRRVARNPIRQDREVFGGAGESVTRAPVEESKGVFTVVVPHIEEADRVTLQGRRPARRSGGAQAEGQEMSFGLSDEPQPQQPARPLASFKLTYKK